MSKTNNRMESSLFADIGNIYRNTRDDDHSGQNLPLINTLQLKQNEDFSEEMLARFTGAYMRHSVSTN